MTASVAIARSAAALAQVCGGRLAGADAAFEAMSTDSRQIAAGDCFVALSGPRFDGHDHVAAAAAGGATVALVARRQDVAIAQVVVDEPLAALQRYAAAWRAQFDLPLVGITGSNGKTTLRALCQAVLAPLAPILATRGNLNNHIGVPLMLCRLRPEHRLAVIEMGANHIGEIADLAAMAQPTVAVVTNAGDAHLEGFGSREGVARGKGEIFSALPDDGIAVINADDAYADYWRKLAGARRVIAFGTGGGADVLASRIHGEPPQAPSGSRFHLEHDGRSVDVQLPLPGTHNARNAAAAAAVGLALGLDMETIAQGLAGVEPPAGRLQWHSLPGGGQLLDDSYNANPDSLAAGVELLSASAGYRVLVLGDMAELGVDAARRHGRSGAEARAAGVDALYALGPLSAHAAEAFGAGAKHFPDIDALCAAIAADRAAGTPGDWVMLVKGSRSAGMERVVAALTAARDENNAGGRDALSPR